MEASKPTLGAKPLRVLLLILLQVVILNLGSFIKCGAQNYMSWEQCCRTYSCFKPQIALVESVAPRLIILISTALISISLLISGSTHAHQCEQLQSLGGYEGYRQRGSDCSERCEGLYISEVSTRLQIVSLFTGNLAFPSQRGVILKVKAPGTIREPVYVRAMAIPLKTYYRMDSTLRPDCELQWPTGDILISYARLRPDQVGLFGWLGTEENKTLVPLMISNADQNSQESSLIMIVRSPVEIEELRWSTTVYEKNNPQKPLSILPAQGGTVVKIDLSKISVMSFEVEIKARERNGDSSQSLRVNIRKG